MVPPVGKSGAFTDFINSSTVASGLSIRVLTALHTSRKLCGGMFVAIPTAIPEAPLTRRFGNLAGSTVGSLKVSSKFNDQSTVSWSRFASISSATLLSLASVYLMAAGGSLSILPKFPCPSTNGIRTVKSCASLTIAS